MKLITNTIEEAKENGEPCIKENFEPETIFDHNMKDLASSVLKSDVVNGSSDSSCKDLKKLNGVVENQNGVSPSGDRAKPISSNGLISLSDCEEISDGELNIIPSDEEENLLDDKDCSGNSCRNLANRSVKKDGDTNSENIVNGRDSDINSPGCEGIPKDSKVEILGNNSCDLGKKTNDNNETRSSEKIETEIVKFDTEKLEAEVVKFDDIKEVTENVTDTIEICTTEVEDSCPPVSSQENSNLIENDDGSDAENDREAKEKLLTLLKETPPELVILPEEPTEFEKDLESDSDEAMLSLLEDSQSDSNLNLLNDVIGSSSLTGFESNKKAFESVEIVNDKSNLKEAIADDCESTNEEIAADSKCNTLNDLKKNIIEGEEKDVVVSDKCSDIKEILEDQPTSLGGKVEVVSEKCSKIQEASIKTIEESEKCSETRETPMKTDEVPEKCSKIQATSIEIIETVKEENEDNEKIRQEKQESIDEDNSLVEKTVSSDETRTSSKADISEKIKLLNENVSVEESSPKICDDNKDDKIAESIETTSSSSVNINCDSKKKLSDVDSPPIKRNLEVVLTSETKKLKRSISCDEKIEKSSRKRSLSVDHQVDDVNDVVKRFRKSIEDGSSNKLEGSDKEQKDHSNADRLENSELAKKCEDNEIASRELSGSDKIVTSSPEKNSIEGSSVNSESVVETMDVSESEKTIKEGDEIVGTMDGTKSEKTNKEGEEVVETMDVSENEKTVKEGEEIVEKSERTVGKCEIRPCQKNSVESDERLLDETKIDDSLSSSQEKLVESNERLTNETKIDDSASPSQEKLVESSERLSNETKIDDTVPSSKDDAKNSVSSSSEQVIHQGSTWKSITKDLSLITKIHKDKFKSLTRWDLEELIVQKICESIADRSVIGDLRQRVKSLENAIDSWRKKSTLIEKSNREMRTVLNRYLKEVDDNIADKSKPLIPIRITRSVGLQVTPPPNPDKLKGMNRLQSQKRPDNIRTLRPNPPPIISTSSPVVKTPPAPVTQRNPVVTTRAATPKTPSKQIIPNSHKVISNNSPRRLTQVNANNDVMNSPSGALVASKRIIQTTPVVSATANSPSVSSDLEVIDLTDKEERNMARGMVTTNNLQIIPRAAGNTIGISTATVGPQMTFVVPTSAMQAVRGNPRQQLILTTTTTNGTAQIRPVTSATVVTNRPNSSSQTLSIPGAVVMKGGTFVPISSQAPASVVVRSGNPTIVSRNVQQLRLASPVTVQSQPINHPAPLPPATSAISWSLPKPVLKVTKTSNGIMLSWSMTLSKNHDEIASYQLYAYQESSNIPPNSNLWKKVGDVKALPLPMACTLTQFVEGHKYHFAVRAVDVYSRVSQFSLPSTILLK